MIVVVYPQEYRISKERINDLAIAEFRGKSYESTKNKGIAYFFSSEEDGQLFIEVIKVYKNEISK